MSQDEGRQYFLVGQKIRPSFLQLNLLQKARSSSLPSARARHLQMGYLHGFNQHREQYGHMQTLALKPLP